MSRALGIPPQSGEAAGREELAQAMASAMAAFASLAERVQMLEDRSALENWRPSGSASLAPAEELGPWTAPVAAHLLAASPQGDVLHADCGEGGLLSSLADEGVPAIGAEPRGAVALVALEHGCSVTIAEAAEVLRDRDQASLGALVLSGTTDRAPFPETVGLLARALGVLKPNAPIVVVVTEPDALGAGWDPVAREILAPRGLHAQTWEFLLQRAGFVQVAPLAGPPTNDTGSRFALAARAPS